MTDTAGPSVELWPIDDIKPYEKNAKKHSDEQIAKLVTAIRRFGWTQPIVVDADGVIIVGHGRRLAAIELGMAKVPVVCRRDLSKEEAAALRLSDNRVVSTEYDMGVLGEEINALITAGFEVDDIGFDLKEIEVFSGHFGEMNTDEIVLDVGDAVEEQKEQNAKVVDEIDGSAAPLVDAFGFKRVTVAQSRVIRSFMSRIQSETGMEGPEALIAYLRTAGYGDE